mgnify:CR=1 FL=1
MKNTVSCFLPCRKGSERVPRKNIKPFSNFENGLLEVKLNQLCRAKRIDYIYLSTNDDEIIEYAESLSTSKIIIHKRSEQLSSSLTSTDSLVAHVLNLIPSGHIIWTHVTSPFVTAEIYDAVIAEYFKKLSEGYDSLMTTTGIQGFIWDGISPVNYDRKEEKWPRTQTLKLLHEVNSAAFIASAEIYKKNEDRIGARPYLYLLDKIASLDVDWPEDFELAEFVANSKLV